MLEQRQLLSVSPVAAWKLTDGTGTSVADSSGNGETGTITGTGFSWTNSARVGGEALNLGASGAYVSASDADLPSGNAARTVSAWVNTTGMSGNNKLYTVFSYGSGSTGEAFGLFVSTTSSGVLQASWSSWGSAYTTYGTLPLTANGWNHLAVTYNGSTSTLFVNGQQDTASGTVTLATSTGSGTASRIGAWVGGGVTAPATVDDVRVYSSALTAADISVLNGPTAPTPTASAGSVALNWASLSGASSYNIYRSTTPGGEGSTPYATATTNTYTDSSVTIGTPYYYTVSAVSSDIGEGTPSTEATTVPFAASSPAAEWKLTDGSGTSVADSSGNGETGTITGTGTSWTTSARVGGEALNLGTNGAYVSASDADLPSGNAARTVSAWVNTAGMSGDNKLYTVFSYGSGSAGDAFGLFVSTTSTGVLQASWSSWGSAYTTYGTIPLTANGWNHLAVTYNGSVATLFVNGQQDTASGTVTLATNTGSGTASRIGAWVGGGVTAPATVDDVRVYSSALTAAEIGVLAGPTVTASLGTGAIDLNWASLTGASSYNIYRSTTPGGEGSTPYATATTNTYTDPSVTSGTRYYYTVSAVGGLGEGTPSQETSITAGSLGIFTSDTDINSPADARSTSFDGITYTVNGGGSGIGSTSDQFNYLSTTVTGSPVLVAHVASVQDTNAAAAAGVMLRDSTSPTAAYAYVYLNSSGTVSASYRSYDGGTAESIESPVNSVGTTAWLMVTVSNGAFYAYYSNSTGTPIASQWAALWAGQAITFGSNFLAGLAVSAANNATLNTSTFNNASLSTLTTPLAPGNVFASSIDGTEADVAWAASPGASSYTISSSTNGGATWTSIGTSSGSATSFSAQNLTPNTPYDFEISADNSDGESADAITSGITTPTASVPGYFIITLPSGASEPIITGSTAWTGTTGIATIVTAYQSATPGQSIPVYADSWMDAAMKVVNVTANVVPNSSGLNPFDDTFPSPGFTLGTADQFSGIGYSSPAQQVLTLEDSFVPQINKYVVDDDKNDGSWKLNATELVVNSTGDAGAKTAADSPWTGNFNSANAPEVTLKSFLEYDNIASNPQDITFNIPLSQSDDGAFDIPTADIPAIKKSVTIDGSTQLGFDGTPVIAIHGSGFDVQANSTTIENLAIINGSSAGVDLDGSTNCTVTDDYLGLESDGITGAGNYIGVSIDSGATNTISNNIISDNATSGIWISGSGSSGNTVTQNQIGLDIDGAAAANADDGVLIDTSASSNTIDSNTISGNTEDGVYLTGYGTAHNTISNNEIGTDSEGDTTIGNGEDGVLIDDGAYSNTIGTGNTISGNDGDGVHITEYTTIENTVTGNLIGTNDDGDIAIANGEDGVLIDEDARSNTIDSNTISGNVGNGVHISGVSTEVNTVSNNEIGTDQWGDSEVPNGGDGVLIDEDATINTIDSNTVSGNAKNGVHITGYSSTGNTISGNEIGTDDGGDTAVPNSGDGVLIDGGANVNTVGGDNVISGNIGNGVEIKGSTGETVTGNYIGTNADGNGPVANAQNGVLIDQGATGNKVVGGNTISGNHLNGIYITGSPSNTISGNEIGTNSLGTTALENIQSGIDVDGASIFNVIDGGNTISGNGYMGIMLSGSGATDTTVANNEIGTNDDGDGAVPNQADGIFLYNGANHNLIGDDNTISGNGGDGIEVSGAGSANNSIFNNNIGTDDTGTLPVPNQVSGVAFDGGASSDTVGNAMGGTGKANIIAFNAANGVDVDASCSGITVLGNSIFDNAGSGIAQAAYAFPVVTSVTTSGASTVISGQLNSAANSTYYIELFANNSNDNNWGQQGRTLVGSESVTTDGNGNVAFAVTVPGVVSNITATATDSQGNTSEEFGIQSTLELDDSGTITPAPENAAYATDYFANTNLNRLGELPMGAGRWEAPGDAYVNSTENIATLSGSTYPVAEYQWTRWLTQAIWLIHYSPSQGQWFVTEEYSTPNPPENDTGTGDLNVGFTTTLNGLNKLYSFDDSGVDLEYAEKNYETLSPGDYVYAEKLFTYQLSVQIGGHLYQIESQNEGQIIEAKCKGLTGTVSTDWSPVENSFTVSTPTVQMTMAKASTIVGGNNVTII